MAKPSPDLVISLLVYIEAHAGRRSYEHTLDSFWDEANANRIPLPVDRPVSGAAFSNARKLGGSERIGPPRRTSTER